MNIVKICGEPAQQMFQYAFYLSLLRHDGDARLDVPRGQKWISSRFNLPHFVIATPKQVEQFGQGSMKSRLLYRFRGHAGIVVNEPANHACNMKLLDATDIYFNGQWLSPRYFSDVADDVRQTFSVADNRLPASSRSFVNRLKQGKSVAVHIHNPKAKGNTCTPDYYNWAIANVMSTYRDAHFYVFTTDAQWAKENLEFNGAKNDFVSYPPGSQFTLLAYLYRANHIIMSANLTSWWAGWLNTRPDSIVIAPEQWSKIADYPDLIPYGWTTIPIT